MGSCYSCKSGGGAPTYTTVKMDNKKKIEENSSVKHVSTFNRTSSSFGFKRRLPTTLKSLSQERTSELVQNYESKIATINNSSNQSVLKAENNITNKLNVTNRNLHSNIPRFSSKSSTAGSSSIENLASSNLSINALDPNCNTLIEGIISENSNSLTAGNKKMGSKYIPEKNKTLHTRRITPKENENVEKIQNGQKSDVKETAATKGRLGKAGLSPKLEKSSSRTITRATSQVSGLPKPQIPTLQKKGSLVIKDSTRNETSIPSFTNNKAPLAKFDDVEAMHVSSDTLTEEENSPPDIDSGIGTSTSEKSKKHDGDNETLVEISELAKDNCDISCNRDEIPCKTLQTCTQNGYYIKTKKHAAQKSSSSTSYKTEKIQTNSNISRPQGLPVPTKLAPCLQNRISSPLEEKKRQLKTKDEDNQKKINEKQLSPNINSLDAKEKHISGTNNDALASFFSSNSVGMNDVIDGKQANCELSSPISPCNKNVNEVTKICSNKNEEMSTSIESSTSQQDSFQDGGLCSPPSERETFLIDDEIADQPELIACQPQELHGIFHSTQDNFCLDHEQFLGDDCNAGQDLYRGGSMETSTTSSISSDDLMLDFENIDDSVLGTASKNVPNRSRAHHSRSCSGSEAQAYLISSTESHKLLCSPKPMTAFELEDGSIKIDPNSYSALIQDVIDMKTTLLKLERYLKEAETLNPFDNSITWKNGLLHNLAHTDPPQGCFPDESSFHLTSEAKIKEVSEENVDLRRQVVFLQQELAEKSKTIKLLQEQIIKYVPETLISSEKEVSNAATQTDKTRLCLSTMSQSYEDSIGGKTVSINGRQLKEDMFDHPAKGQHRLMQASLNVTQSLNSLSSNKNTNAGLCHPEQATFPPERSASAVELCPHGANNTSVKSVLSGAANHKHSKSLDDGAGTGVVKKKSNEISSQLSRSKIAIPLSNKGMLRQQPKMGTGVKSSKTTTINRSSSKNSTVKK